MEDIAKVFKGLKNEKKMNELRVIVAEFENIMDRNEQAAQSSVTRLLSSLKHLCTENEKLKRRKPQPPKLPFRGHRYYRGQPALLTCR